jgi:serine/threonine-protein kinase RsbW
MKGRVITMDPGKLDIDSQCLGGAGKVIEEFDVPGQPDMLSYIRAKAADFARALPFTEDQIDDIRLAVGEACSNAIRHGSNRDWCRVGVRMERRKDSIDIVISDRGCGFDPNEVRSSMPEDFRENGRGIAFMVALMDEVDFQLTKPGTRVRLTKRLRH